ncbi:MAG: hypothetical protein K0R29_1626 [Pseudobdellovibrio sp.]|jgi:hypothetical protein|nr:hypothetical protein [Pseudobdellovibrio sp.]
MRTPEIKWKAFLASILFHVILIASLTVGLPYSEDPSDTVEISITSLEDDPPETEKPSPASANALSKPVKLKGKDKSPGKKAMALFPKLDLTGAGTRDIKIADGETAVDTIRRGAKDSSSTSGRFSFKDPRSYDTDIGDIFGDGGNENWAHFKEIYTKVDSNLNFDSILAQYNHFGRVYVQFELDEKGILKTENLKVDAKDSILKVHVLRAIKKSFSAENALLNSAKGDKGLLYQARFDFNFGNYQQNFSKQREFGRPVFSFRRFTEEKPVPEELLEQLLTGGVSPNISSMYERWQKYNEKKRRKAVEFDPFSSYKNDPFYSL